MVAIPNFTLSCIHPLRTTLHCNSSRIDETMILNLPPPMTRDCFMVKDEEKNCFAGRERWSFALRSGCWRRAQSSVGQGEGGRSWVAAAAAAA